MEDFVKVLTKFENLMSDWDALCRSIKFCKGKGEGDKSRFYWAEKLKGEDFQILCNRRKLCID